MNILILSKGLGLGGAETIMLRSASLLKNFGCNFIILNIDSRHKSLEHEAKILGIKVYSVPLLFSYSFLGIFLSYFIIKKEKIDIIHSHLPVAGIFSRIIGFLFSIPVVYTEHSVVDKYNRTTNFINKVTYNLNEHVIAVSAAVYHSIIKNYSRYDVKKLKLIENGVDVDSMISLTKNKPIEFLKFNIRADNYVFGTIASFRPMKRIDLLIFAFGRFLETEKNCNAILLLVGHGSEIEFYKKIVDNLKIHDKVIFTGMRYDAVSFLKRFDTYVNCSDWEGLPISLLEAMSLSKDIIATGVGGVPELLSDGYSAQIISPGDVDALYCAMKRSYYNSGDRYLRGCNAFDVVCEKFSIHKKNEMILNLYDTILNGDENG